MTTVYWCFVTLALHVFIAAFFRGLRKIDLAYTRGRMRTARKYKRAADRSWAESRATVERWRVEMHAEFDRYFPGQRREVRKDPPS